MTTIELSHVSRWYGNVVAINDITMTIGPSRPVTPGSSRPRAGS